MKLPAGCVTLCAATNEWGDVPMLSRDRSGVGRERAGMRFSSELSRTRVRPALVSSKRLMLRNLDQEGDRWQKVGA